MLRHARCLGAAALVQGGGDGRVKALAAAYDAALGTARFEPSRCERWHVGASVLHVDGPERRCDVVSRDLVMRLDDD